MPRHGGRRVMASGDAQKVWFPELIALVRQVRNPAMSIAALLRLRDRLDTTLQTIRQTRQIRLCRKFYLCTISGMISLYNRSGRARESTDDQLQGCPFSAGHHSHGCTVVSRVP